MPSLGDSAFIFVLALLLFGPKKLPELARQLGKLMGEFRRASNEFRMQMEDELRIEEQKEHQKKVDAMAGPPSTQLTWGERQRKLNRVRLRPFRSQICIAAILGEGPLLSCQ